MAFPRGPDPYRRVSPIGEVAVERPGGREHFSARDDDRAVRRADADSRAARTPRRRYVAPEDADIAASCARAASYSTGLASTGRNDYAVRNHDLAAISTAVGVAAEAARADPRAAEAPRSADGLYAPGRGDDDVPAGRIVAAADSRPVVAVAFMVVFCRVGHRGRLDARAVLYRDVSAAAAIAGRPYRRRAVSGDRRHVGIPADRDVAASSLVRRRADCRRV